MSHYDSEAADLARVTEILNLLKACEFIEFTSERYLAIESTVETWQRILEGMVEAKWRHNQPKN